LINENSANDTTVGIIVATDPDAGQTLNNTITAGSNGTFTIDIEVLMALGLNSVCFSS